VKAGFANDGFLFPRKVWSAAEAAACLAQRHIMSIGVHG